jgi:hypothetical protein
MAEIEFQNLHAVLFLAYIKTYIFEFIPLSSGLCNYSLWPKTKVAMLLTAHTLTKAITN